MPSSLRRSLTAPPTSALASLTEYPESADLAQEQQDPISTRHHYRAHTHGINDTSVPLGRVTSRSRISQEDPFNCSGFFPGAALDAPTADKDWEWVRDQEHEEQDGRGRSSMFLLDEDHYDMSSVDSSPVTALRSLPLTPAPITNGLMSPSANEFNDVFAKEIQEQDKMGVLGMSISASRIFLPAPDSKQTPLHHVPLHTNLEDVEAIDHDTLHGLLSARRLKLTTETSTIPTVPSAPANMQRSQSMSSISLFSPIEEDNLVELTGGERMLQRVGDYVAEHVQRVVGKVYP